MTLRFGTPDRRKAVRGGLAGEIRRADLNERFLGMYCEMPGLRLTASEAARLCGVSERTAGLILEALRDRGAVRCDADGRYVMNNHT